MLSYTNGSAHMCTQILCYRPGPFFCFTVWIQRALAPTKIKVLMRTGLCKYTRNSIDPECFWTKQVRRLVWGGLGEGWKGNGHSAVDMDSCMRNEMGPGGLHLFLSFVVWLWSVIWHYWGVCIFASEFFPASDRSEAAEKASRKKLSDILISLS